jgi:hypothetical protein
MRLITIILISFCLQEIPFKAKEEFDLKLAMQFKTRPANSQTGIFTSEAKNTATPLPFISIDLTILKILEDELRVKVLDNSSTVLANVNLEKKNNVKLELGFADDIKDQVGSHKYHVNFHGADKAVKRTIVILFEKDGTFYVNGEKRGKI